VKEDVARNEAGIEMGKASFQSFFKDFCPAKMDAEEFAEKVAKDKIRNS